MNQKKVIHERTMYAYDSIQRNKKRTVIWNPWFFWLLDYYKALIHQKFFDWWKIVSEQFRKRPSDSLLFRIAMKKWFLFGTKKSTPSALSINITGALKFSVTRYFPTTYYLSFSFIDSEKLRIFRLTLTSFAFHWHCYRFDCLQSVSDSIEKIDWFE